MQKNQTKQLSPPEASNVDFNADDKNNKTEQIDAFIQRVQFITERLLASDGMGFNVHNKDHNAKQIAIVIQRVQDLLNHWLPRNKVDFNAHDKDNKTELIDTVIQRVQVLRDNLLTRNGRGFNEVTKLLSGLNASMFMSMSLGVNARDEHGWTALMRAVVATDQDALNSLLAHKDVDVNARDKKGKTALMYAAKQENQGLLDSLLAHKDVDVNARDKKGKTALMYAAEHGHQGLLDSLLAHKNVDVNARDQKGKTALIYAAKQGNQGLLDSLLAHPDVDVNVTDSRGFTALMYAYQHGNQTAVDSLVAHGADLDVAKLMLTAHFGDLAAIEEFKEEGYDIHVTGPDGWTALMHAAAGGQKDTVEFLLGAGADINAVNQNKITALMYAAAGGFLGALNSLLARKAVDVNARDKNGKTALMHAAELGHEGALNSLLAHKDVDVNVADSRGFTALMYALKHGNQTAVDRLVSQGADLDVAKLMLAAHSGDIPAIIHAFDKQGLVGWTALVHASIEPILAAYSVYIPAIKAFDKQGPGAWTPLMHAAAEGKKDVVDFLQGTDTDNNAVNQNGFSALMLAMDNNRTEIIDSLQAKGATLNVAKLMLAARFGDFAAAKEFANAGHDIYAFSAGPQLEMKPHINTNIGHGPGDWTVLMHAAQGDQAPVTEEFIEDYIGNLLGAADLASASAEIEEDRSSGAAGEYQGAEFSIGSVRIACWPL